MKERIFLLLLPLCIVLMRHAPAAASGSNRVDSLMRLLSLARHDSDRFKLNYELACERGEADAGTWKALQADARKWNMPRIEIGCALRLADLLQAGNQFAGMAQMLYKALVVAQRNAYKPEMLGLCKRLQSYYSGKLDTRRTLYFLYRGIALAEELGRKETLLDLHSSLSVFHIVAGDLQKGLDIQLECLEKCRAIGYDFGIVSALLDIGTIYTKLGQHDQTIRYYLESKDYIHAVSGVYAVQVYASVGDAYRYRRQYDSAAYYTDKAHELATRINDHRVMASTLVAKGYLAADQRQFDAAERYAREALSLSGNVHFHAQLPPIYLLLERVYTERGDYRNALKAYKSYISFRDSLSNETTRKHAAEKAFAHSLEKKESENKLLAQEGQIKDLRLRENETKLRQNRYFATGIAAALIILLLVAVLFVRQNRYRTQHRLILLEQKLLRMQMNPHFVFNSLNSIQGFVMENENRQAELYLSKFATLLRDLLNSNINDSLTVEEETGILGAYLEMEALRFGASFTCSLHVDERIDRHKTRIPHLMIQPFVENAIWHGLLPKEGEKILSIRFAYHTRTSLVCTVEDNGVGREASAKHGTGARKKSLAMSFARQRMELIRKSYRTEGGIGLIDKKDPGGNATGTTVVITVPILNT